MDSRANPWIPLLLLVPAPSIGVLSAMVWWPETALGSGIFAASKAWLFLFPVIWYLLVERERLSWSPPRKGGLVWGVYSGLAISAVILLFWVLLGPLLLDLKAMRAAISELGLDDPERYTAGALYWIFINSVLEEYVWRWFVVSKSMKVFGRIGGILAAALFFTVHHIIALSVFMDWLAVLLCSLGVFTGGIIWSYFYARFESIWPGYLSHAIVDLCVFGIGAFLLFGI